MKHEWKCGRTASTPDSPPEGYSYCDKCGTEEDEDNRDEACPVSCATCGDTGEVMYEFGFSAYTEPLQVEEPCPDCGGNFP